MPETTLNTDTAKSYDIKKVNNVTEIRKLETRSKPYTTAVTGCKGLKVYKEASGRTTFILMVLNPETDKYKQLAVGDFDIQGSKENLTVEEARIKAEIVRAEFLKQSNRTVVHSSNLNVNSLYSEIVSNFLVWLKDKNNYLSPYPRTKGEKERSEVKK